MNSYYNQLSTEQKTLIEARLNAEGKSAVVTYLLALFFFGTGVVNFYLDRKDKAWLQLGMYLVGYITLYIVIGIVPLMAVFIWAFLELFQYPQILAVQRAEKREELSKGFIKYKSHTEATNLDSTKEELKNAIRNELKQEAETEKRNSEIVEEVVSELKREEEIKNTKL